MLDVRDQLRQHSRERVDLVPAKLRARGEPGRMIRDHPLEPEHQCVANLPFRRRCSASCIHLPEGVVESASASPALCQRLDGVLVGLEERLARPCLGAEGGGRQAVRDLRRNGRMRYRFLHERSARALQPK
jgi:hypothetical protein